MAFEPMVVTLGKEADADEGRERRRDRLERLLEFVQESAGWSRRQLAQRVGRQPTANLVPPSGYPKLDVLMRLAELLEWEPGDVLAFLADSDRSLEPLALPAPEFRRSFGDVCGEARRVHDLERDGQKTVDLAKQAMALAGDDADRRARAANVLALGYDALGLHRNAIQVLRRVLGERHDNSVHAQLTVNLANAYYALWELDEAAGLAESLVRRAGQEGIEESTIAFAYYVSGNAFRRMLPLSGTSSFAKLCVKWSRDALRKAEVCYTQLDDSTPGYAKAMAHTCKGALLEVEAFSGKKRYQDAIGEFLQEVPTASALPNVECRPMLESYGWWAIFGCNTLLRFSDDAGEIQRTFKSLREIATAVAEETRNWTQRERVLALAKLTHERIGGMVPIDIQRLEIESHEQRWIPGVLGRYPHFWEMRDSVLEARRAV